MKLGVFTPVFGKLSFDQMLLEVPVVATISGCPGDSDDARHANWVTCPWPPEYLEVLEAPPGFLVYNTETALRLRQACGPNLGVNFDRSHFFFWQGMEPPVVIRDALASVNEGLGAAVDMLHRAMFSEPAAEAWWR